MDYKGIFLGLMIALVVVISGFSWASHLNEKYVPLGGTMLETDFYNEFYGPIASNGSGLSMSVGNSSETGGVSTDPTQTAILSSRGTFSTLRMLMGFVPSMFNAASAYLGIPKVFADIAGWTFNFIFGLTLAYLIFLGVRKLVT